MLSSADSTNQASKARKQRQLLCVRQRGECGGGEQRGARAHVKGEGDASERACVQKKQRALRNKTNSPQNVASRARALPDVAAATLAPEAQRERERDEAGDSQASATLSLSHCCRPRQHARQSFKSCMHAAQGVEGARVNPGLAPPQSPNPHKALSCARTHTRAQRTPMAGCWGPYARAGSARLKQAEERKRAGGGMREKTRLLKLDERGEGLCVCPRALFGNGVAGPLLWARSARAVGVCKAWSGGSGGGGGEEMRARARLRGPKGEKGRKKVEVKCEEGRKVRDGRARGRGCGLGGRRRVCAELVCVCVCVQRGAGLWRRPRRREPRVPFLFCWGALSPRSAGPSRFID